MRHLMLLAAGAAALALTACERQVKVEGGAEVGEDTGVLRTVAKLDCPETQGILKRVSAAADGLTCAYTGDDSEVTLRLVALNGGTAQAALAPLEAELQALMPERPKAPGKSEGGKGESVRIDFPGLHIHADDNGAKIDVGGVKIDADDENAEIRVDAGDKDKDGGVTVNADEDGAEIRRQRSGEGVRSTYILASDKAVKGYHVVGYEARGPVAGPLVVAVTKARKDGDHDEVFDDIKDLVERNVGE